MKRKIKSSMLNLHIGSGIAVFFICLCLLSCDDWFDNKSHDLNLVEVYAEHSDIPSQLIFTINGRLIFTQPRPDGEKYFAVSNLDLIDFQTTVTESNRQIEIAKPN